MSQQAITTVEQTHEEPFYWLNEDSKEFLREGYLLEDVEPKERVRQIAERAEELLDKEGFADKFYEYMSRGFYSLASPVWANFGLDRGLPISCFGSHIEDNMESILSTQAEVGEMTKQGGGTSGYFGELRPRGSPITNNGKVTEVTVSQNCSTPSSPSLARVKPGGGSSLATSMLSMMTSKSGLISKPRVTQSRICTMVSSSAMSGSKK